MKARPTHSGLRCLFVCLCFFACRLSGAEEPDLLFVNGNIYTVNAPQPRAESIAVKNHRVVFVGSNSNGNNAYFVRKDKLCGLRPLTAASGYVKSKFRESRDAEGRLSYIAGDRRLQAMGAMVVYDVEKNMLVKIEDLQA